MTVSEHIYDKYLKPILENADIWRTSEVFFYEFCELAVRLTEDNQVEDIGAVLDELIQRREALLEKYPLIDECYFVEVDKDGNRIGEPRLVKGCGLL